MTQGLKFEFDTAAYMRSHGVKPKGYGLWCLSAAVDPEVLMFSGTLTEVKEKAKEYYRTKLVGWTGIVVIEVLP